jgi:hypothetical protein
MPGSFYFSRMEYTHGNLFNSLSEEQKRELLLSYEESFDEENLLDHETVKLQHAKWLDQTES